MVCSVTGHGLVERRRESQQHAVAVGPNPDGLLHGAADIAHPLEAAVVDAVHMPAVHAARVELAVGRAEPAAVHARAEVADERHDGPLRLAGHLVAEHEEVRARSE